MHHPTDRIIHTTAFVTPVVEHWLEREIAQCAVMVNKVERVSVYLLRSYIIQYYNINTLATRCRQ